jgi:hypothetical protein
MIFPASTFLYLLPLAALPVVFHLVLKRKRRTVVFSTLMFFRRIHPKLNSRRKLRHWLLLLTRVLLIALLLLALSRPKFVTSMGLAGNVSVVAIVDNSGSMSAQSSLDDGRTKLECAVEGARGLISGLEKGSQAAVVPLVDDPALHVVASLTSDKKLLLDGLDEIGPTEATGDAHGALARAFKLLRADPAGGGAVHVFTDLQRTEWDQDAKWSDTAGSPVTTYFHKIDPKTGDEANVSITGVQHPQERILPKQPYEIGVALANTSDVAADIRVNSVDNQSQRTTESVALEPGGAETVTIETVPDEAGHHWIRVWIEGDGFSADNQAGIGVLCEETAKVLFAGMQEQFGVLPLALSPSGRGKFTGMVARFCPPEQVGETLTNEDPILLVTTWNGMQRVGEESSQLREYVEDGGGLLIVPSLMSARTASSGKLPDWLGSSIGPFRMYPQGVGLEVVDSRSTFWHRLYEAARDAKLEVASLSILSPLRLSAEFSPLLKTASGEVAVAHRKLGKGNIYVSGTAFSPRWNSLPSTGLLVVMVQRMAVAGSSEEQRALSLVAGEYPHGIGATESFERVAEPDQSERSARRDASQPVEILSLVGDSIDWKGAAHEIPLFAKAGVYLLKANDSTYCVSVRASAKEGLQEFVESSHVPIMGRATHNVSSYSETQDYGHYHAGQTRTVDLYVFLLLLATLALLAEGWLGSYRPVQATQAVGQEESPARSKTQPVGRFGSRCLLNPSLWSIPVRALGRSFKSAIGKSARYASAARRAD